MPDFQKRFALTSPATINTQTREVEAVIATATPVQRRDARGNFVELLLPGGLDLPSAQDKPILDNHRQDSINALLGRVANVRIEGGSVIAKLQFSKSADVLPIFEKIADSTIKSVSVGYEVLERQTRGENGRRIVEVTRWRIGEVSLVSIPADNNTGFRSKQHGGKKMDNELNLNDDGLETRGQTKGISGETDRTQIRALARNLEIEPEIADKLIDSGATLEVAKAKFFDALQTRNGPKIEITSTQDDPKTFERRVGKALSVRMGLPLDEKDNEAGAVKELMNRSIGEIAIEFLNKAGLETRGTTPTRVFEKRSLTTSDFPKLLESAGRDVLLQAFRGAESGLKQVCTRRDLPDFRPVEAIRLSEMGRLLPLAEDGEIVASSRDESGETMAITTYGRKIEISRKALINDYLGGFGNEVREFAVEAARTEAILLAEKINTPGSLSDGNPVFELGSARANKGRGNITGGHAFAVGYDLGTPRQALRERKSLDGKTILGLRPAYLVVASNFETIGEKLLTDISPVEVQNANPFAGAIKLLVEPRLDRDTAYLVAMPSDSPSLSYSYLESAPGPQIRMRENFNTLAISYRVVLDYGANWIGWRGWQKITR